MLAALAREIEALVDIEQGRIYVRTDRINEAVIALTRVFGIASVSPALSAHRIWRRCNIAASIIFGAGGGQSFAVKARREGNHPYTSMEVGKEVGSAIF